MKIIYYSMTEEIYNDWKRGLWTIGEALKLSKSAYCLKPENSEKTLIKVVNNKTYRIFKIVKYKGFVLYYNFI